MDSRGVEQLSRALSYSGARRGVLQVLTSLPLLGGLAALIAEEKAESKGRRAKPHHEEQLSAQKKRKKKKRKKKCKPQSLATTCDGKCGPVTNNCKQSVDCGSDACEPDAVCHEGTCQFCGLDGELCCAGDTCQSDDVVCLEGTCASCGSLGEPCCADNTCIEGTCAAGQCQL